jgi:hypothetical protein
MERGQCRWDMAGYPLIVRKEGLRPQWYRSIDNSSTMGMGCGPGYYINSVSNPSRCPSSELEESDGSYYTEAW